MVDSQLVKSTGLGGYQRGYGGKYVLNLAGAFAEWAPARGGGGSNLVPTGGNTTDCQAKVTVPKGG